MIRDITIGQYYPADSLIDRLDRGAKLGGNDPVYCIYIFVSYISGVCSGSNISHWDDTSVKGAGEIYF